MQTQRKIVKNNSGFTLLEVLVAMIILAIMSVPFARSFATATQTNRKARIEAKCNNAAENIAESFRNVKVEELVDKYNTASYPVVTTSGVYTFEIHDQDLIKSNMPDGYYATVTLDPSYYENANGLNLSQIAPVSIKDSAIYTMEEQFDNKAYAIFEERNKSERAGENIHNYKYITGTAPDFATENLTDKYAFLRENLYRTITITIKKRGQVEAPNQVTPSGESPEMVDLVEVTMKVEYELKDYSGKFFAATSENEKLTFIDTYLFDNSVTKQKYRGAYLFFYPRYAAGSIAGSKRDTINIENYDNIDSYVYLVALSGAADESTKKEIYGTNKGLHVNLYEDYNSSMEESAITLRTNLNTKVPYSSKDTSGDIKYNLSYFNKLKSILDSKLITTQNVDGKSLDKDEAPVRIYKMIVRIYDDKAPTTITTPSGGTIDVKNPVIEFDGTKLEF